MDMINPRAWLERAQSSDVGFSNMAFDGAVQPSEAPADKKHSDSNNARIVDVSVQQVAGRPGGQPTVVCMECTVPAKRVMASATHSLIEHTNGMLTVVSQEHSVVWAGTLGDTRCAWWLDSGLLGVVAVRPARPLGESRCVLSVVDIYGAAVGHAELCEWPEATVVAAAQDTKLVCVVGDGSQGTLRSWHIDAHCGAAGVTVVATAAPELKVPVVTDLRWVGHQGLAIALQAAQSFWLTLAKSRCEVRPAQMSPTLPPLMPSWRWREAVVAGSSSGPILCLPSPATAVFYHLSKGTKLNTIRFSRGWAWLCGSPAAFVLLSPCRRKAAICRMPLGRRLFTVATHSQAIQDAWMLGPTACCISAGSTLYLIGGLTNSIL
ncbi:hypothetical protein BX070DRAFT_119345 [Coemansia spiralis]|nr:hypothetical protein BX070DRAFT_119345 [Coemansia spiralis]